MSQDTWVESVRGHSVPDYLGRSRHQERRNTSDHHDAQICHGVGSLYRGVGEKNLSRSSSTAS